jgi:DNA-binding transcriptional ArsR family regulator
MKGPPPALLPLLRSAFVGELLAWLFLHPDTEYSGTELASRFAVSQSTVSREADLLVTAGLVAERKRGNLRLLRARRDTAVARPLTELLALTYGPIPVLTDLLRAVPGVVVAHIYGSWAARYKGEFGPVPNDVDVLVVGDPDEDELYDAARAAERVLGREVNIRRVSPQSWLYGRDDPFLVTVQSGPLVALELNKEQMP